MNKDRRKFKKKTERQSKVKSKILNIRSKIREEAKKRKEEARLEKRFRIKLAPFKKDSALDSTEPEVLEARKVDWVKKKLEHNMKILEALEKEMEAEEQQRQELNDSLETKGAFDLKDKMNFMGDFAEAEVAKKDLQNDQNIFLN